MTEDTQVQKKEAGKVAPATPTTTTAVYVPEVDISENEAAILLDVGMPGADAKSVEVTVEKNVLTITGKGHVDAPEGYRLVGQEYEVGGYRRDFSLSDRIDADAIKATVAHGVLHVTLPKKEEVKPRKIAIKAA